MKLGPFNIERFANRSPRLHLSLNRYGIQARVGSQGLHIGFRWL
jgi:hypothetical protein